MTIITPGFFGLILRKNTRTQRFIARETERLLRHFPQMNPSDLNEDSWIIGFSVAMNGADLDLTINDLQNEGAIRGHDFVPTSSHAGVLDSLPAWLIEAPASDLSLPEFVGQTFPKCYRLAAGHEGSDA